MGSGGLGSHWDSDPGKIRIQDLWSLPGINPELFPWLRLYPSEVLRVGTGIWEMEPPLNRGLNLGFCWGQGGRGPTHSRNGIQGRTRIQSLSFPPGIDPKLPWLQFYPGGLGESQRSSSSSDPFGINSSMILETSEGLARPALPGPVATSVPRVAWSFLEPPWNFWSSINPATPGPTSKA